MFTCYEPVFVSEQILCSTLYYCYLLTGLPPLAHKPFEYNGGIFYFLYSVKKCYSKCGLWTTASTWSVKSLLPVCNKISTETNSRYLQSFKEI